MKKVLFTLLMFAGMFSAQAAKYVKAEPCTLSICILLGGEIGLRNMDCKRISLQCLEWGYDFGIVRFGQASPGKTILEFTTISPNKLGIAFYTSKTGPLEMPENFSLPAKVSALLGYKEVVILKGQYDLSKRNDGAYYGVMNIQAK